MSYIYEAQSAVISLVILSGENWFLTENYMKHNIVVVVTLTNARPPKNE